MEEEQSVLSTFTIEELYERKRRIDRERSQRLANLPIAKKLEIAETFTDILRDLARR